MSRRQTELERLREDNRRRLSNHQLVPVSESGRILAWYLKDPKQGRAQSCLLMFHPEGVTIQGDWTPDPMNAAASHSYKDLIWFTGEMNSDYLAGKFLERAWSEEDAADHLEAIFDDHDAEDLVPVCNGIPGAAGVRAAGRAVTAVADIWVEVERLHRGDSPSMDQAWWEAEIIDSLYALGWDSEYAYPSLSPRVQDEALLAEFQCRFRELFWLRFEAIQRAEDGTLNLIRRTTDTTSHTPEASHA